MRTSAIIRIENFRILEKVEWSPEGVCLLCGPNGAGKSTMLDALIFFRSLFQHGMEIALSHIGGTHLRRLGLSDEVPVVFEITVGDISWKLRLPVDTNGLKSHYGEELYRGGDLVLRAAMHQNEWYLGSERRELDETRCCAKWLWDRGDSPWMKPLVDVLQGIRVYKSYWMNQVMKTAEEGPFDGTLHWNGRNLWRVLEAWKGSPIKYREQFSWVFNACRRAFPESVAAIEIEKGQAALYRPGFLSPDDGLPPKRMAEGVLTGLLHLTAVAGATAGSIVAIDEMENQLHPHAIRSLVASMRDLADEKDLTVLLTTHSPILMNEFRNSPEQLYVIERGSVTEPVPLDELHDADWLAVSPLGDLYDQLQFASPFGREG